MLRNMLVVVLAGFLLDAASAQDAKVPIIKKVPAQRTQPDSPEAMFKQYCAVCHGTDMKGTGPAAPALKTAPADLTLLSRKNNGKFPELRVFGTIGGDVEVTAHGSREMPVWGSVFHDMSGGNDSETKLRLRNLTKYLESKQVK
jgi:mono/diheme cytochrome c family protein